MLCKGLSGGSNGSTTAFSLDGSGDMIALPFMAESTDAITGVYVYHNLSYDPTPTYKVSLQELDANGKPSGTILGGGSPASATFNAVSLGWGTDEVNLVTLDNSYTPFVGQFLVAVIEYDSGTINSSNRTRLYYSQSKGVTPEKFPYYNSASSGSTWTVSITTYQGLGAYATASSSYGLMPLSLGVQSFSSSSSPNEYGVKFTVPSHYASYKIRQVWIPVGTLGGDFSITLYSGGATTDKTALHSVAYDEDWFVQQYGTTCVNLGGSDDSVNSTLQTLTGGNTYRIAIKADTTTSLSVRKWEFPSSALRAAMCCDSNTVLSTRSGTGDWTDDDTMVMPFAFVLEDIVASGGGGSAFTGIRVPSRRLGV